jgi:hypothetical protein
MYGESFSFWKGLKKITWSSGGALSGDSDLIKYIQAHNKVDHGLLGEPPCPMNRGEYLRSFASARDLFLIVLSDFTNDIKEPSQGFTF